MACCAALAALIATLFSVFRRLSRQREKPAGFAATAFRPAPGHTAALAIPVREKIPPPSAPHHSLLLTISAAVIITGLAWLALQNFSNTSPNADSSAWLIKLACTGKATNRELAP